MGDPHGDVAVHQVGLVEITQGETLAGLTLVDDPGPERRHDSLLPARLGS